MTPSAQKPSETPRTDALIADRAKIHGLASAYVAVIDHARELELQVASLERRLAVAFEDAAKEVPSNWLDPLLTGDSAVLKGASYDCKAVERLLSAIRFRISSLIGKQP